MDVQLQMMMLTTQVTRASRLVGVALAIACLFPCAALADFGSVSSGGTPTWLAPGPLPNSEDYVMKKHPAVSLQSEVVNLAVGKSIVRADSRCVFQNNGSACTVRIGFPDIPYAIDLRHFKTGGFRAFSCDIDGSRVTSKRKRGGKFSEFMHPIWYVCEVHFPARSTRTIHFTYTVPVGFCASTDYTEFFSMVNYYLFTGLNWHGNLNQSTVCCTFDREAMPQLAGCTINVVHRCQTQSATTW